jgi:hypothetical protein
LLGAPREEGTLNPGAWPPGGQSAPPLPELFTGLRKEQLCGAGGASRTHTPFRTRDLSLAGEVPPRAAGCRDLASRGALQPFGPLGRVVPCRAVLPIGVAQRVARAFGDVGPQVWILCLKSFQGGRVSPGRALALTCP